MEGQFKTRLLHPIQLPADRPGTAAEYDQIPGAMPPTWEMKMEILAPSSSLAQPLAAAATWTVNQWIENEALVPSPLLSAVLNKSGRGKYALIVVKYVKGSKIINF